MVSQIPAAEQSSAPRSTKQQANCGANHSSLGTSWPLGATVVDGGVNFSLYSRHAARVELLLFDRQDAAAPARVIDIDPACHRSYHYWHVFVPGLAAGQIYGYRVQGPVDPERGLRFDPAKVLLDPYACGVMTPALDWK